MENVLFAYSWKQYFQRFGLNTFDDFYYHAGDSTVNKNTKRNVQKFTLGDTGDRKVLFIKRFHNSHLKDIFAAAYNFGWPTSQAHVEWENAQYLLWHGIDTYKPVCIGKRTRLDIEIASFLVTEQLDSVCLLEFVIESWYSLDRPAQDKIIVAIAEFVRRIHELDLHVPDLYLWHLFIRQDSLNGKIHFSIIDLHRMRQNRRSSRMKIKELGRLYWSMSADYFDDEHKNLLIRSYLDGTNYMEKADALRIIRRCSANLGKRRKLSNYYRHPKIGLSEAAVNLRLGEISAKDEC